VSWIVAGAVGFGAAIFYLAHRSQRRRVQAAWDRAAEHERNGRHADACYDYALAAAGGLGELTAERVRALWSEHGPLSFDEIGEKMRATYCEYESCGEGFHQGTLEIVGGILGRAADLEEDGERRPSR
jgi:hypothetical protein